MSKTKPGKSRASTPDPAASPGPGDRSPTIDIGIGSGDRKKISQGLSTYLSDASRFT